MNFRKPTSNLKKRFVKKTLRQKQRNNISSTIARFNSSRSRYYQTKRKSSLANAISETKLLTLLRKNELVPSPIQTGALAHMLNFTLGGIPAAWSGFTDLEGMSFPTGTGSNQRVGSYIYLKKSHLNLEIDMKNPGPSKTPVEFRVIVYKARRLAYPAGQTRDPATSLFLNEEGGDFGHATSGVNGTDLMIQPLNKRIYTIKSDTKFVLSPPWNTVGYSGHYPVLKRMSIDLPFYTKVHFHPTTLQPTDVDYHWAISIYARSVDKDSSANDWEVNTRGNTQYMDN